MIDNTVISHYNKYTQQKEKKQGIYKKNGHCPCRVTQDETTLCPCDEFISTGVCRCKLFIKKEEN
jgi:ferredoxin-thioredoxin reductase catalytic subunit